MSSTDVLSSNESNGAFGGNNDVESLLEVHARKISPLLVSSLFFSSLSSLTAPLAIILSAATLAGAAVSSTTTSSLSPLIILAASMNIIPEYNRRAKMQIGS